MVTMECTTGIEEDLLCQYVCFPWHKQFEQRREIYLMPVGIVVSRCVKCCVDVGN